MAENKVQKSLRFDRELSERVAALKRPGESDAGVYGRVVDAGVSVLEKADQAAATQDPAPIGEDGPGGAVAGEKADQGTVAALTKAIDALSAQLEAKDAQIAAKDDQIVSLTRMADQAHKLTDQAQSLQLVDAQQHQKALEAATPKRGILARLFGR
ncbi:hypothetical protein [Paratractidigestivibacter sp.]|uniref:hypothetical protein n=1 Tax=Paratractidigestivibacter sp. TaxID=2847316 RepID=UPI002ABE7A07|nr:hypothetical protein [Paratractidigestivibacter sp.]